MKNSLRYGIAALALATCCQQSLGQELQSIPMTDAIKSQGTGNIDLFKDTSASQLEQLRLDNAGMLVFAVDINEAASGTEKASTQGVAIESVRLSIGFDDGSERIYDASVDCCFTETQALLAAQGSVAREAYFTLLGESGSSRISSSNSIQDAFDSTLKIRVGESLSGATSARLDIVLLQPNESLGDPEAFYDFSAGFEDLALVTAADAAFIDSYAAGREEAPTVILTNPPETVDTQQVVNWNYFPSANTFYMVGYEDLYPNKGDYDFNDLIAAYRVQYGLNTDGKVVAIHGLAYMVARGSSYSHDWHLSITAPAGSGGTLQCDTYTNHRNPVKSQPCAPGNPTVVSGNLDILLFSDSRALFPDPAGSQFVNSQRLHSAPWNLKYFKGPKSEFRVDLDNPVALSAMASAPFDPYLHVLDSGAVVHLMEVDPAYQDSNGFPFGMLLTSGWQPPLEFTDTSVAYPYFQDFVSSKGSSSTDWYNTSDPEFIVDIPGSSEWAW